MRIRADLRHFRFRLLLADLVWAAICGPLAFFIRDGDFQEPAVVFTAASFAFSIVAFLIFRTYRGIASHASIYDALQLVKAVLFAELLTALTLFWLMRLEGVPRTIPIIHALLLLTGLMGLRALRHFVHDGIKVPANEAKAADAAETIIVIGCNRVSSLYLKMLKAISPNKYKIAAILDKNLKMQGRSLEGVQIIGQPASIEQKRRRQLAEHGIVVDRVIVGGGRNLLPAETLIEVERVCAQRGYRLDFVPEMVAANSNSAPRISEPLVSPAILKKGAPAICPYFQVKRVYDLLLASALLILLSPLIAVVALFVLIDIGSPVLFWQQRIGRGGQTFLVHKFRTMRPLFDSEGMPIPNSERMTWIGSLIRKIRADELPQLWNVLIGNMSIVGPRPLLPGDQPSDPTLRLMVRPGITGWAQVNGGKALTPAEKNRFDEWYVRNASFGFDLRILVMTIGIVFRSENAAATIVNTAESITSMKSPFLVPSEEALQEARAKAQERSARA